MLWREDGVRPDPVSQLRADVSTREQLRESALAPTLGGVRSSGEETEHGTDELGEDPVAVVRREV
jgi:hypothetical protein